jgi:hypothetical protein
MMVASHDIAAKLLLTGKGVGGATGTIVATRVELSVLWIISLIDCYEVNYVRVIESCAGTNALRT